jgi:hypothetical protein
MDYDELLDLFVKEMGANRIVDDPRLRPLDLVANWEGIPRRWTCPGVYRLRVADRLSPFFGAEYIGKSINVRRRVLGHIWGSAGPWLVNAEISKSQLEARVLTLFTTGASSRELLDCEHYWTSLLRPSLNSAKTGFGRKSATTAFCPA